MSYYFNDVIDEAICAIYYKNDVPRAHAAFEQLKVLAAKGDADAKYLLARCYAGDNYVWKYFEFPEDDHLVERYMHEAVLGGSAMAVLGSMRTGMLSEELERRMPFESLRQVWELILEKAQAGCAFCQNMIGNTYYWLDIVRILDVDVVEDFPSRERAMAYLRDAMLNSVPWYEKAVCGGMGFAARNVVKMFLNGEEDLVEPDKEKAIRMARLAAQHGSPEWMGWYGKYLMELRGHEEEGLRYCVRAAQAGNFSSWYDVGKAYQDGTGVQKDLKSALASAEKGIGHPEDDDCCFLAGELYLEGAEEITPNPVRAVQLLERGRSGGSTWGNDLLAFCYIQGLGCLQDIDKAASLLDEVDYNSKYTSFVYGYMYTEGLGVRQNMAKGMKLLRQSAEELPYARQYMENFRRNLFGIWVRR